MSGFNPDDYLAAPAAPVDPDTVRSISPEAEERAIRAMLAPQVGAGETALNNLVDAIPLGGRLRDILQAIGDRDVGVRARLTPQAREELIRMGEEVPPTADEPRSILDTYRTVRDERRARTQAGTEQNPNAARLGTAGGIGLSIAAPLPAVKVAATAKAGKGAKGLARLRALTSTPAFSRLASATATGSAYGALSGATDGEADLTRGDIQGVLADTARGAVTGAAWGAAGGGVAEGARKIGPELLRRLSRVTGRYNAQGASDIAAAGRKPMRDESVDQLLDDDIFQPWSTTRQTYERISTAADKEGAELGRIVQELEKRGVKGPDARALADELLSRYKQEWKTNLNNAEPEVFRDAAEKLVERAGPAPGEMGPALPNLGFAQAERIKSNAQRQARFDRINTTGLDEARQEIASRLRQANEDQVASWAGEKGRGRGDKIMAGKFKTQKKVVGNYLDAQAAAERGASKEMQRAPVGLKDTIIASSLGLDPLTAQAAAAMNAGVMRRVPSTVAWGAERLRGSLLSGRAAERLGVGGASFGPFAADEAERWADTQDLDDPNLNPKVRALLELLRRRNPPQER